MAEKKSEKKSGVQEGRKPGDPDAVEQDPMDDHGTGGDVDGSEAIGDGPSGGAEATGGTTTGDSEATGAGPSGGA